MANAVGQRDNFSGDISVTAPTGGYTAGRIYLIGKSYFVARETVAAGATCKMALCSGPVWVEKSAATGRDFAVGDTAYVASNIVRKVTSTGAVMLAATCILAAGASDTKVLLHFHSAVGNNAT